MDDLIAANTRLETVEPATHSCLRNEGQAWIHKLSKLCLSSGISSTFEALPAYMCCQNLHCETRLIQSFRLVLLPTAPKMCAAVILEYGLDYTVD